jgi:DNA end-binding protein Ku
VEIPEGEVKDSELKLATQLIEQSTTEEFHPEQYEDDVKKRVLALIEKKRQGEVITAEPQTAPQGQIIDLMEALKESLAQMEGKKKGPQRAIEAQRESQVQVIGEGHAPKKAARKKRGAA